MTLDVSAIALNRRWEFPPSAYDLISISRQTVSTVVQRGRQFTMWNTSRHRGSRTCASAVALTETNVVMQPKAVCSDAAGRHTCRTKRPWTRKWRTIDDRGSKSTNRCRGGSFISSPSHCGYQWRKNNSNDTFMLLHCYTLFFFLFVKYGLFLFGEEVYDI